MNVIDYITEEVRRQGHDVTKVDGLERVGWMIEAWVWMMAGKGDQLVPAYIAVLGTIIERDTNRDGLRRCNVRVGMRVCPHWQDVPRLLEQLCANQAALSPIEFYRQFELIHPFVDGNGRVGKILLAWKGGTMLDPVFPPDDLFGERIGNP